MRAASPALIAYINALRAKPDAQAIVADCYTFTLLTGLVLTYTNADLPVTLNGYVYAANSILVDGLKFKCAAGLEVDQQQITISARATDTVGGVPFLQALRNGVFDGCEIQRERAFLNSWSPADTAAPIGSVILFKGRIGTIDSIGRTTAQITVNSDLVLLDLQMPRNVYSPACQHVLYDSGCTLVKSAFGTAGTVGAGSTGSLIGVSATVKSSVAGVSFHLHYALLNPPATGDAFTVYFGCDHTQATCTSKFNNLANFRGFPYIPGPSYAV
jgi:hypothetical protein